jgi:hypothetical protein
MNEYLKDIDSFIPTPLLLSSSSYSSFSPAYFTSPSNPSYVSYLNSLSSSLYVSQISNFFATGVSSSSLSSTSSKVPIIPKVFSIFGKIGDVFSGGNKTLNEKNELHKDGPSVNPDLNSQLVTSTFNTPDNTSTSKISNITPENTGKKRFFSMFSRSSIKRNPLSVKSEEYYDPVKKMWVFPDKDPDGLHLFSFF